MTLTFNDEASKPTTPRENPFREVVKFLAANDGAVKSYVIAKNTAEESYAQHEADKRKMAEAGDELEPKRTVRTRTELLNDKKSVKVYLWATSKIQRKPLSDEAKKAAAVKRAATRAQKAKSAKK